MNRVVRTLALAAALAVTAGMVQARSAELIEPERVVFPVKSGGKITADQAHDAILQGARQYGWTVADDKPGVMLLKFTKLDKHEVVVRATYDAEGFQLSYVSSINLNYQAGADGIKIHPNYNKWIRNLQQAIESAAVAK